MADSFSQEPPGQDPTQPISFSRLMAFKPLGDDRFSSLTPAWSTGEGTAAFGGHVFAQSMWVASKTVADGMVVHVSHHLSTSRPAL